MSPTSQILANGIHAFVEGSGVPVVMLSGWPETADAYSDVAPLVAKRHYRTLALDPPGLGSSAPSERGYDVAAISKLLDEAVRSAVDEPFHLVGHDIGAWLAYAFAAQFPDHVKSLTILDSALPGLGTSPSYPLPYETNIKLWQFSFNALPDLPELLTHGREAQLLDWLFDNKAAHPERISKSKRQLYVDSYTRPGIMSHGFAYYRSVALSSSQDVEFAKQKLPMPVLAFGGESASGISLLKSAESLADDVQGGVIDDCGHYLMEEQPHVLAEKLLGFFEYVETK